MAYFQGNPNQDTKYHFRPCILLDDGDIHLLLLITQMVPSTGSDQS